MSTTILLPMNKACLRLTPLYTPVIIVSVSPVVSVAVVLLIRSLSGHVVGPVASRTVGVHMSPLTIVVVLIPMLLILMVPVAPPGGTVTTAIVELSLPLPVSSICRRRIGS